MRVRTRRRIAWPGQARPPLRSSQWQFDQAIVFQSGRSCTSHRPWRTASTEARPSCDHSAGSHAWCVLATTWS